VISRVSKRSAHAEDFRPSYLATPSNLKRKNCSRRRIPSLFLQAQDWHPAPARSSCFFPREPPRKKTRLEPRPGGNVSAALQVAPPCGPRASPDHPTWWLIPPGTQHGQGADKTAHFSRWVPKCPHQNEIPNQKHRERRRKLMMFLTSEQLTYILRPGLKLLCGTASRTP
jgi:hypothetical protein